MIQFEVDEGSLRLEVWGGVWNHAASEIFPWGQVCSNQHTFFGHHECDTHAISYRVVASLEYKMWHALQLAGYWVHMGIKVRWLKHIETNLIRADPFYSPSWSPPLTKTLRTPAFPSSWTGHGGAVWSSARSSRPRKVWLERQMQHQSEGCGWRIWLVNYFQASNGIVKALSPKSQIELIVIVWKLLLAHIAVGPSQTIVTGLPGALLPWAPMSWRSSSNECFLLDCQKSLV